MTQLKHLFLNSKLLRATVCKHKRLTCLTAQNYPDIMSTINKTDKSFFLREPMILALGKQEVMYPAFMQMIGKKAANLYELSKLKGINVPEGFVLTAASFDHFVSCNKLFPEIQHLNNLFKSWQKGNQNETIKKEFINAHIVFIGFLHSRCFSRY